MFARDNILSGQGPQIPTIVVPQNGAPVKTVTLVDPSTPDTVFDCVAALETQDEATYANWAATGGSVVVGSRDHWTSEEPGFAVTATAVDATTGEFTFRIPATGTNLPGIYLLEVGLYSRTNVPVVTNGGYLEVTPSAAYEQDRRPISVASIRRAMRDAHARNNRVLEECEFSLAEIMDQIQFTVDEYNMTNFPQTTWSQADFPHSSQLLTGVVGHLLEMAALWYARNDVKLQAAGLSADDMGKAQIYMALSERYLKRWMQFVIPHKRNLNVRQGWGTVESRTF